jgi:hypothetical protein
MIPGQKSIRFYLPVELHARGMAAKGKANWDDWLGSLIEAACASAAKGTAVYGTDRAPLGVIAAVDSTVAVMAAAPARTAPDAPGGNLEAPDQDVRDVLAEAGLSDAAGLEPAEMDALLKDV